MKKSGNLPERIMEYQNYAKIAYQSNLFPYKKEIIENKRNKIKSENDLYFYSKLKKIDSLESSKSDHSNSFKNKMKNFVDNYEDLIKVFDSEKEEDLSRSLDSRFSEENKFSSEDEDQDENNSYNELSKTLSNSVLTSNSKLTICSSENNSILLNSYNRTNDYFINDSNGIISPILNNKNIKNKYSSESQKIIENKINQGFSSNDDKIKNLDKNNNIKNFLVIPEKIKGRKKYNNINHKIEKDAEGKKKIKTERKLSSFILKSGESLTKNTVNKKFVEKSEEKRIESKVYCEYNTNIISNKRKSLHNIYNMSILFKKFDDEKCSTFIKNIENKNLLKKNHKTCMNLHKFFNDKNEDNSTKININDYEDLQHETEIIITKRGSIEEKESKKEDDFSSKLSEVQEIITSQKQSKFNCATSQNDDKKGVKSLTSIDEINDFYEFTEECMKKLIKFKIPSSDEISNLYVDLPFEEELKTKKVAIFDLDETLFHCELKKPQKAELQIMINLPSGGKTWVGLNIRPHWKECLQDISENYLIISFTASHQSYADSLLDFLDPNKDLIKYRLYRQNCIKVLLDLESDLSENENKIVNDFVYVKDLRIIRNVKMQNMVIIDNSVLSFAFHIDNGIPILPYYKNENDNELIFLKNYLNKIASFEDLRIINRQTIKLYYFYIGLQDQSFNNKFSSETEFSPININQISNHFKNSSNSLQKDSILLTIDENNNNSQNNSECLEKEQSLFEKYSSKFIIYPIQEKDKLSESEQETCVNPQIASYSPSTKSNIQFKNSEKNATNDEYIDFLSMSKKCSKKGVPNEIYKNNSIYDKIENYSPIKKRKSTAFQEQLFLALEEIKFASK